MAYFQNRKPGDAFLERAWQGKTPSAVGGPAPGTPAAPDKGGFVNLSTYLGLNASKGQEMANTLGGSVRADLDKASSQMGGGLQEFNNALGYAAKQNKASPFGSVADTKGWAAGMQTLAQAAPKAQQLGGTFGQRQGLVNEAFGTGAPTYSQGQGLYDNALASHYGGEAFRATGGLAEYLTGMSNAMPGATASAASAYNSSFTPQSALDAQKAEENKRKQAEEEEAERKRKQAEYEKYMNGDMNRLGTLGKGGRLNFGG